MKTSLSASLQGLQRRPRSLSRIDLARWCLEYVRAVRIKNCERAEYVRFWPLAYGCFPPETVVRAGSWFSRKRPLFMRDNNVRDVVFVEWNIGPDSYARNKALHNELNPQPKRTLATR